MQFLKIGNNLISLEAPKSALRAPQKKQTVILPIQANNNNVKRYKTLPKPIALPTFGIPKVRGTFLLANTRLESQRNEVLTAPQTNNYSEDCPY